MNNKRNIGIFSGSKDYNNNIELRNNLSYIGKNICPKINNIIYGGGISGLMGIIPINFHANKGKVIGYDAPRFNIEKKNINLNDICGEQIMCSNFVERQNNVINHSDIILVLPGGIGTIYELFQVLVYNDLNLWENKIKKKIIIYNYKEYFNDIINFINNSIEKGFIKKSINECLYIYDNVNDILNMLNSISIL